MTKKPPRALSASMTLLENVEQVLDAVADLRDLRNRLAELDEERATIEERIRRRLTEIADAAASPSAAPRIETANLLDRHRTTSVAALVALASRDRVLATVNAAGRVVGAMDIAEAWGKSDDEATINSIRAALSRLTADKKIVKVGYGRYTAKGGESAV